MKSNRILLLLLLSFATSYAQQLSKQDAVSYTLEHNFGITIAQNNVRTAKNNAGILNSGYLPSLSASAGGTYQNQSRSTSFNGAIDSNTGLAREDIIIEGIETKSYNAGLNLNYTLFDGLDRYYNYKKLKETYNVTELQARETIENTIIQLFSVYYQVARLIETKSTLEETLKISQERVTRAKYRFDYGQTNKLEILNANVDVVNDSVNLISTKQELTTAKRDLNLLMNKDLSLNFSVDTLVQFTPQLQLQGFIDKAKDNNVTLLQNQNNIRISDYDVKISKSGYLPTIGLFGSYGWNQNRNPENVVFFGQESIIQPGNILNTNTYQAGLSLSWNIFDGGSTLTRIKNAKITYENQEILKNSVAAEVKTDLANAKTNYEVKLQIYKMQQNNVVTNLDNFERSKERYKLGQITSIEFRQAQINLTNAKANKSLAKYDAKLAELQLLQLTGQLLNSAF